MKSTRISSLKDALALVKPARDRHALRMFNVQNSGQPPSVAKLARELGFEVCEQNLPFEISGRLEPLNDPFGDRKARIVVNVRHSNARKRFTVLHEMAHFYLHPRHTDPLSFDDGAYRSSEGLRYHDTELAEEREANEWVDQIIFGGGALRGSMSLAISDRQRAFSFGVSLRTLEIAKQKRGLK